jgi:probable HAF family extracellular repeat protein
MQDLGTLPGDKSSVGVGIDDNGPVSGLSIDATGNIRAFLWQNGAMNDLNSLIPADSALFPAAGLQHQRARANHRSGSGWGW